MASIQELTTVVDRMLTAGWPDAVTVCGSGPGNAQARQNWRATLLNLADMYLTSGTLRVDTLVQLGPLARSNVAAALDLAGWEETPVPVLADDAA